MIIITEDVTIHTSNHPHKYVKVLGVYKDQPFVTGSDFPGSKKTEIMNQRDGMLLQIIYSLPGAGNYTDCRFEASLIHFL